jgi:hypothetical protein
MTETGAAITFIVLLVLELAGLIWLGFKYNF